MRKPEVGPDPGRLGHLVKRIVDQGIRADWSTVFARIEEIDQTKLRATVKPLVKLPVGDGERKEIGPIYHVPVDFDRAGPFYVRRPYQPKDIVLLNIHDVSLERVLLDHEPQDPGLRHVGKLHDAVAHGGYRAESDPYFPPIWTEDWLQQNTDTMDTLVWYKRGGVQWILPGTDGRYSFRLDAKDIIRLVSYAAQVILHAAHRIQIGEEATYHALLAEPVIETYNGHQHICPACGAPTSPPIQPMSLDVHASQLVWLKKEIPGPMQMPYVVGLWGHAPAPPADKVWDPVGFVGELIAAGLDAAAEFVENALGQAYEAICNCCKAAVDTIKKHVDAALKWAKEKLGEIAKYVVDTFVNVVKEKILKDPRGFLHRLFTDPIGLGAEIAGDTLGKIAQDVTGIDVGKLIQDGLNAVKNWAVNTIGDAVKAGLEGLGLEGAAKVVGAIQTGVNVAQQTGSWAKGVAAGIRSLGGNEAQTAVYFAGTILGAVEAATGT